MMRAAFRAVVAAALIAMGVAGVVVLLFIDTLRRYGLFDRTIGQQHAPRAEEVLHAKQQPLIRRLPADFVRRSA
jgi:hypothetical protein